jgi:hypothetical protein
MLQLITRRESAEADVASWKHDGEISLSGSMTRQVCNTVMWLWLKRLFPNSYTKDGARPPGAGWVVTCTKRWEDG